MSDCSTHTCNDLHTLTTYAPIPACYHICKCLHLVHALHISTQLHPLSLAWQEAPRLAVPLLAVWVERLWVRSSAVHHMSASLHRLLAVPLLVALELLAPLALLLKSWLAHGCTRVAAPAPQLAVWACSVLEFVELVVQWMKLGLRGLRRWVLWLSVLLLAARAVSIERVLATGLARRQVKRLWRSAPSGGCCLDTWTAA